MMGYPQNLMFDHQIMSFPNWFPLLELQLSGIPPCLDKPTYGKHVTWAASASQLKTNKWFACSE